MNNFKIAQIVVGLPVEGPFDYKIEPEHWGRVSLGARVWVLFRNQRRVGYTVGFSGKSRFKKLNPVLSLIDVVPIFNQPLLELTHTISDYYAASWGEVIETALPELIRKGRPVELLQSNAALAPVLKNKTKDFILLHDPFQEKKWSFLFERLRESLQNQEGIICLVPEITMIPTILKRLKGVIPSTVTILDKKISRKEELDRWVRIKNGESTLVVGTRSALFAPVQSLGLIVIFDEENAAYKQEQAPFYHARSAAVMRAQTEGASLILVSSAPSAEAWTLVQKKKFKLVSFPLEKTYSTQLIDLTNYKFRGSSYISFPLRNQIERTLRERGKVLLLMNRRGFNLLTRCSHCGYTFQCPRCNVNLTTAYAQKKLICRLCGYTTEVPSHCPQCRQAHLQSLGTGIEKLESETARIFPQARLSRYDKDSKEIPTGFDILVGTQAVLRLKEQLSLSLVGVISIDAELNRFDFRSGERTFSLLVHLRELAQEKLVVQTRLLDHYCLKAARHFDFRAFYKVELALRKELGFPPFRHAVAVGVRSFKEVAAMEQAFLLYETLEKFKKSTVAVHEPHPDLLPKLRDKYRFTIHLRAKPLKSMLRLIKKALKEFKRKKDVIVSVNVDP